MPIYTAQTPNNQRLCRKRHLYAAVTLTELVVVLAIISLFVVFPAINVCGLFARNKFKTQANEFVSTMQMAANAAAESDRKYEVIIDLTEQTYTLREITSTDLSVVLEEEIIVLNEFSGKCLAAYVEFDDLEYTNEDRAKFRAGRTGWEYGGKIVLVDSDDRPYSVVVNRVSRLVELKGGDVSLLRPRQEDEIRF